MQSQIVALVICSAVDIIVSNLQSFGNEGIKKSVSFALGLVACIIIALPVFNSIKSIDFFDIMPKTAQSSYEHNIDTYVLQQTQIKLEEYVKQQLLSECGINVQEVCIELDIKNNNIEQREVYVKNATVKYIGNQTETVKQQVLEILGKEPEITK